MNARPCAQHIARSSQNVRVSSTEIFIAGPGKENGWLMSKKPKLPEGFQQRTFKGQMRAGHGRLLHLLGIGILCSCSCPCRSGHDVPINLNNSNVILYSATFYRYVNGKVLYPLKVRALRKGYPVYFKLSAMFLTQSKGYRTQRLKSKTQIK